MHRPTHPPVPPTTGVDAERAAPINERMNSSSSFSPLASPSSTVSHPASNADAAVGAAIDASHARRVRPGAASPAIHGWRDALQRLQQDASPGGWRRLREEALHLGCPAQAWSSLYARTILQRGVLQAALLAVLEEPPHQRSAALDHIARTSRAAFAPPPPSPARGIGDFEHRLALRDAASSPPDAVDLCIAFARAYAEQAAPPAPDAADQALDAARSAARRRDHRAMSAHTAHAAACAMRGASVWDGWLREGPQEFQAACVVLVSCLDWLQLMQRTPLPAAEALVSSLDALRADIEDRYGERRRSTHATEPAAHVAPLPLEQLLADIAALAGRGELPPGHPAQHDPEARRRLAHGLLALCHTRAEFEAFGVDGFEQSPDAEQDAVHAAMSQLEADCITALGRLRTDDAEALHTLLHRAVDPDLHPAVNEAAVWALQEIGAPSLPLMRATFRYASDPYARQQALLAFGGAARGNPQAFDELAALFHHAGWQTGRRDFALPLALTGDPRAAQALIAALLDAPPTNDDVTALLDALDQLSVAWRWQSDIAGIELPNGVRIAGLPGLSYEPVRS